MGDPLAARLDLPIVVDLSLDYRVLAFAVAISLVTGVAFGLAPALKATRVDLVPTLRGDGDAADRRTAGSRSRTRWSSFQVAVSVVLLGGTSLFLQMLRASRAHARRLCGRRRRDARDGRALRGLLASTRAGNVYEEIRRRVAAIPGVQSAVLTRGLPMRADWRADGRRGCGEPTGTGCGGRR